MILVAAPEWTQDFPWVVVGASIAAVVSLTNVAVFAALQDRRRRQHELELATIKADHDIELAKIRSEEDRSLARLKVDDERLRRLRDEAASFSGAVLQQGEYVSLLREPGIGADLVRQSLIDSHGKLRIQYERLLLTSESVAVQSAARLVLRAAWNEREGGLGRLRKRERRFGHESPVKELRAELRAFTVAVRKELGMSEDLLEEPTD